MNRQSQPYTGKAPGYSVPVNVQERPYDPAVGILPRCVESAEGQVVFVDEVLDTLDVAKDEVYYVCRIGGKTRGLVRKGNAWRASAAIFKNAAKAVG